MPAVLLFLLKAKVLQFPGILSADALSHHRLWHVGPPTPTTRTPQSYERDPCNYASHIGSPGASRDHFDSTINVNPPTPTRAELVAVSSAKLLTLLRELPAPLVQFLNVHFTFVLFWHNLNRKHAFCFSLFSSCSRSANSRLGRRWPQNRGLPSRKILHRSGRPMGCYHSPEW